MNTAKCRSCGREIIWTISPAGKRLPLDARAVTVYSIVEVDGGDAPDAEVAQRIDKSPVYVSHFLTCPTVEQHTRQARS